MAFLFTVLFRKAQYSQAWGQALLSAGAHPSLDLHTLQHLHSAASGRPVWGGSPQVHTPQTPQKCDPEQNVVEVLFYFFFSAVMVIESRHSSNVLPLRDRAGACPATFLVPSCAQKGSLSLFSLCFIFSCNRAPSPLPTPPRTCLFISFTQI